MRVTEVAVAVGPPVAGEMPVAFAAESFTAESFVAPASFAPTSAAPPAGVAASAGLAAPAPAEVIELFDVVCSFHSVVLSSVDFGVAQSTARKHNKANPGHDVQPIRQQQ